MTLQRPLQNRSTVSSPGMDQYYKRSLVTFAFWAVIAIGIPIWWQLTTIYRAPLPWSTMAKWDVGELCRPILLAQEMTQEQIQKSTRPLDRKAEKYNSVPGSIERDLRVFKYAPQMNIVFHLINGGGPNPVIAWEIEDAVQGYMRKLLKQLAPVHNLSIESHIQFNGELPFKPEDARSKMSSVVSNFANSDAFFVPSSRLPAIINTAEWDLTSAASMIPAINLVLYVPRRDIQPLLLLDDRNEPIQSNSILIPQWGSVQILNTLQTALGTKNRDQPTDASFQTHLSRSDLQRPLSRFVRHLLTLLDIQTFNWKTGEIPEKEVQRLLVKHIAENVKETGIALASLGRLTRHIVNMEISDEIVADVKSAIQLLEKTCKDFEAGNYREALLQSTLARGFTDRAYSDPEIDYTYHSLEKVKIGVYLPLFGPLVLPLVRALLRELVNLKKWLKNRRRGHDTQSKKND